MARETVAVTLDAETYDRIAAREGSERAAEEWIRETLERCLAADAVADAEESPPESDGDRGI